jgi:hypothetical protein
MARVDGQRSDLVQRNEDEAAICEARVRKLEIRFTELKVSHHQDIQVESARAIGNTRGAVSAKLAFERE